MTTDTKSANGGAMDRDTLVGILADAHRLLRKFDDAELTTTACRMAETIDTLRDHPLLVPEDFELQDMLDLTRFSVETGHDL